MLFHEFVRDRLRLLLCVSIGPCGRETRPEIQIEFPGERIQSSEPEMKH